MKSLKSGFIPYIFLIPAGIILIVFFIYPLLEIFRLSFTEYHIVSPPQFNGLKNYIKILSDQTFWITLKNSIIYLVGVVPPLVIFPLIIAILVNNKLKGISFFRAIFYLPVIISMVVVGIAWKWLYAENGVLNYLCKVLFLTKEPIGWLTDPKIAIFSVMAVTVWKGLGYYMVIYLAGLQTIPEELYESGYIDGTNSIQKHIYITIPLLIPSISLVTIVSSISALKVFTEIFVMTGGGPINSSSTLVYYLYQEAFENLNLGYASAIGVVLFFMILIFSIINLRFFEKGH